jgi:hypothetical protein
MKYKEKIESGWASSAIDETAARGSEPPRPPSPCTRVCTLDDHDVCLGCSRTLVEIVGWSRMTAEQQTELIAELPARGR